MVLKVYHRLWGWQLLRSRAEYASGPATLSYEVCIEALAICDSELGQGSVRRFVLQMAGHASVFLFHWIQALSFEFVCLIFVWHFLLGAPIKYVDRILWIFNPTPLR